MNTGMVESNGMLYCKQEYTHSCIMQTQIGFANVIRSYNISQSSKIRGRSTLILERFMENIEVC
jgi:hypothetical protein